MMARLLSGKEIGERAYAQFVAMKNDISDPSPWHALFLDRSLPMDLYAKAAHLKDTSSWSRQFGLALIRPICRLLMIVFKVIKVVVPNALHSSKLLHFTIYLGQKYFVSPEANYVIMRHFHVGTQILRFIAMNIPGVKFNLKTITPTQLRDIYDHEIYLNHDLNLYNFVIQLNESLRDGKTFIKTPEKLDFSAIEQGDFGITGLRDGWTNIIDAETAIELYTPIYRLLLRDSDFWRAHHSLQFDESVALYVAQLLGNGNHLGLVNNKHPLAPLSGFSAAPRLILHGIASELLHGLLAQTKRAQENPSLAVPLKYDQKLAPVASLEEPETDEVSEEVIS